jgi:hypothetical protein
LFRTFEISRVSLHFRASSVRSWISAMIVNAHRNYERYLALAREATLAGDPIEAENCYQHAEHYFRVMRER